MPSRGVVGADLEVGQEWLRGEELDPLKIGGGAAVMGTFAQPRAATERLLGAIAGKAGRPEYPEQFQQQEMPPLRRRAATRATTRRAAARTTAAARCRRGQT